MSLRIAEYYDRVRGRIEPGAYRIHDMLPTCFFTDPTPTILVGGSNGKGTTCAYLESILRHNGYCTGLFTSPHLVSPNERIRIAGVPVDDHDILKQIQEIDAHSQGALTFFELLTACAFRLFLRHKVQVVICEVGLGGRYDSTNAISPSVSVLTSVSLEHTTILGSCVSDISFDKCHIGRRNVPLVVGNLPAEAMSSALQCAEKIGFEIVIAELDKDINLNLALTAVDIFAQRNKFLLHPIKIQMGIQNTKWPGRFDSRMVNGRQWLFDVCHNPEGADFFLNALSRSEFSISAIHDSFAVIFGIFSDKDWQSVLGKIEPIAAMMFMTRMDTLRSVDPELLVQASQCSSVACTHVSDAIARAEQYSDQHHKPLLVIGSVALVGSVMEHLAIRPLAEG